MPKNSDPNLIKYHLKKKTRAKKLIKVGVVFKEVACQMECSNKIKDGVF